MDHIQQQSSDLNINYFGHNIYLIRKNFLEMQLVKAYFYDMLKEDISLISNQINLHKKKEPFVVSVIIYYILLLQMLDGLFI